MVIHCVRIYKGREGPHARNPNRVVSYDTIHSVNRIVADRLVALGALAEKHRVLRLYLFGSALSDAFDPSSSDLDFLVEFKAMPAGGRADSYFGLLEDLEMLLGRPIDLVELDAIRNPYFREEVEKTKRPLYEAA